MTAGEPYSLILIDYGRSWLSLGPFYAIEMIAMCKNLYHLIKKP